MTPTDPTPYTPTDDEVRVLAQWIAQAASDWIDVESDEHEHGLACTNWEAYVGDAHDALVDLDARARGSIAARAARVRAEAVAPVLALHTSHRWGDGAQTCDHCTDPDGIEQMPYPCPTVRAVSIEQETKP